jgi:hypothetical protein
MEISAHATWGIFLRYLQQTEGKFETWKYQLDLIIGQPFTNIY